MNDLNAIYAEALDANGSAENWETGDFVADVKDWAATQHPASLVPGNPEPTEGTAR